MTNKAIPRVTQFYYDPAKNSLLEVNMKRLTSNRELVTISLIDNDKGLPVENSVVGKWEDIMTEDNRSTTINELLLTKGVNVDIFRHNKARANTVNKDVLTRTGKEVMLRPIKLKDLTWVYKVQ